MTSTAENTSTFDLVVIGGGPGGYAAALYGAAAGLHVAIVEKDLLGGTCLHRGCVPAKAFLETASVWRTVSAAAQFGIESGESSVQFSISQARKQAVVASLFKGLSTLIRHRNITVISGTGRLLGERVVEIVAGDDVGQTLTAPSVILASGSSPRVLSELDVDGKLVVTSDQFLELETLPASAAVIGGGAIGCEFASLLSDLGVETTIVEGLDSILDACDSDVKALMTRSFKKRKIQMITSAIVQRHEPSADGRSTTLFIENQAPLTVEMIVVSVGRQPNTLDVVANDVALLMNDSGFVVCDETTATSVPGVYAVGDIVAGSPQLAHVGFAEAIVAVKTILGESVQAIDYSKVPWAIYSHPEVAFAGLTEAQAIEQGFDIVVQRDPFGGNSRAHILGEIQGMVKIIAERNADGSAGKILGVHMVGPWVTEQLGAGYYAVNLDAGVGDVALFLQPHPSLSETFGETLLALTGRGLHS